MADSLKIVGIDPGSRVAGYGLVQVRGGTIEYVGHGVLKLPATAPLEERLLSLREQLQSLLEREKPNIGVIEKIFLGKNAASAFILGHARGVCLVELAQHGVEVAEYASRQIKKGVTGNGSAMKEQVALLVLATLGVKNREKLPADATDALAMAFYHATMIQVRDRFKGRNKDLEI